MKLVKKQMYQSDKPPLALRWRPHDDSHVRVWNNSWFGDQFEIIPTVAFNQLSIFCKQFGIPLVDYTDED